MALTDQQQDQVDQLKRLIGDVDLGDEDLYTYITGADGDLNTAAAGVWSYKAAATADLVDVKEGSSSRSLSQLRTNALAMRDYFHGLAEAASPSTASRTRIGTIERPNDNA